MSLEPIGLSSPVAVEDDSSEPPLVVSACVYMYVQVYRELLPI